MAEEAGAAQWITALTALVAVIVSPWVSYYVAKMQTTAERAKSKTELDQTLQLAQTQIERNSEIAQRQIHAQVVSSNRQHWINNLRDTLADALAAVVVVSADTKQGKPNIEHFRELT